MSDWTDGKDYSGQTIRNVDLSNAKIVGALMTNANFSGEIGGLKINEIEVAPLIARELERRYPERKDLFSDQPDGMRKAVSIVEALLAKTWERARGLTEVQLNTRVDDEWSTVETIRHLVFALDAWINRALLGQTDPFHPIALPPTFLPPTAPGMSCDPSANPTFEEALEVWETRMRTVREVVDGLKTKEDLLRPIVVTGDGYPPAGHETQVVGPLWTVLEEIWWHNFFINRDLNAIEEGSG